MDHIFNALKRAREENAQAEPEGAEAPAVARRPDTIAYTRTQVVTPDNSVLKENRLINGLGPGPTANAYRLLRTQVLQRMRKQNWTSLAITSPGQSEGKSLTAVNLAISMAMEVNQTVLLVDLDLQHPGLHRYFGYEPERGLNDYLGADVPLSEILFNPSVDRMVVLPGREPVFNSSETLSSPAMVRLVEELKSRYPSRYVLFDLPPLLESDDTLAFSPYVEAVLLVVEDGRTQAKQLERSMEILEPVNVLGTVLNKGKRPKVGT